MNGLIWLEGIAGPNSRLAAPAHQGLKHLPWSGLSI